MKLSIQRRLASIVLKCSPKRIRFNPARLEDVKEAITKTDMRLLSGQGGVRKVSVKGVSRGRARKIAEQKRKGLRRGPGSKKGTPNARLPRKERWVVKVRSQRAFIKELKEKGVIDTRAYRVLYRKVKGNFFRSKRHIKLFMNENDLAKKPESAKGASSSAKKGSPKKVLSKAPAKGVKK
ncbi:50S ribosomal protein L19e [Candidatus Woesearchaeota archaeon]|nr:MAG: 50S ribosomal protein L19e [Candidatus Woesearchaeota archaeon]